MHPSLSVIAFTTLSGAGYGLLALLGLGLALDAPLPAGGGFPLAALAALALALGLITVGLLCSLLHLGQPRRAWRALSQWRSSWLSREGVMALLTYVPALALGWALVSRAPGDLLRVLGVAALALALATVWCTAMIYASLKTIRAWRNGFVPAAYLAYALVAGAALSAVPAALAGWRPGPTGATAFALAVAALAAIKLAYWRWLDGGAHPATPESATGLGAHGRVRSFERPHTQESFVTREMAFVLARRHARMLRVAALALLALAPALLLALALLAPRLTLPAAAVAALALLAGGFLDRWLFFAEARHVVSLYFGAARA
ncbi:MAG TPA: DmsC/YnfH family molybdoenzyme membrane anchor subunit [Xanthomonadaceae bacterium]|nr:DmsC/YnfH family molybdoenzyme membrane anchor subunit [Xanthomonadaceae bacterium]